MGEGQDAGVGGAGHRTELTPDLLERLRSSGIRIDREGRFWHEGEPVRHEGLRQALFRWLDRNDDGRYVLRLDPQRFAYVDVEDTPLVASSARWEKERAWLGLTDGSEETLDPRSLTVDDAGVLRCRVRGGKLEARIANAAAAALAEAIELGPSGARLRLGDRTWDIPLR